MGYGGANIVNELLFNQLLAVPDAVEHFPHRNGRDGVLADQAETLLVFSGSRVFHPEQAVLFNAFAESRRFDGRQTVVHVVKEMFVEAELTAHCVEQFRRKVEVFLGGPKLLVRPVALGCRLIRQPFSFRHTIGGFHPRHAALHANSLEAHLFMTGIIFQYVVNGVPGGMTINHHPFPGGSAQKLIERHVRGFRFDVPQRHIHGRNR